LPEPLENIIVAATPDADSFSVTLIWANGVTTVSSFKKLLGTGVMKQLADPSFFLSSRVGEYGRSLAWPNEIEFCADALWFEAHPEDNPFQQSSQAARSTMRHSA